MPRASSRMVSRSIPRSCISLLAMLVCACGSSKAPAVCTDTFDFVVLGSDYGSSEVGGASLDGKTQMKGSVDLGADPVLAKSAGRDFLIARDTGAIFELDPRCGVGINRFSANDTDVRPNPQDLAVAADGSLWVPRYNAPLLVLPKDGPSVRIDLSMLDDDGNPEASGIVIQGTRAFVALERLETMQAYKSVRPSMIGVFDTTSRALVQTVTLQGRNPTQGSLAVDGTTIWLADSGNFDLLERDAGFEKFDTTTLQSSLVLTEPMLGGNALAIAASGGCGVALLADTTAKNATSLVVLDLLGRRITMRLLQTDGFDLEGLWLTDQWLVAGDRRKEDAGYPLHVFKRAAACTFARDHDIHVSAPPIALK